MSGFRLKATRRRVIGFIRRELLLHVDQLSFPAQFVFSHMLEIPGRPPVENADFPNRPF